MRELEMNKEQDTLNFLGVMYFVFGVALLLQSLLVIIILCANRYVSNGAGIFFGIMVAFNFTLAILNINASDLFKKHRFYKHCFNLSIINCFFFPFGTILGVFSLYKLTQGAIENKFIMKMEEDKKNEQQRNACETKKY
ncbi:hypothetical protein AAEX28_10475 [Lentisphaerota bacterium WC36G]|nr:hypothetical protein LJT99_13320 [Lentisphaerae bacterium WC36]